MLRFGIGPDLCLSSTRVTRMAAKEVATRWFGWRGKARWADCWRWERTEIRVHSLGLGFTRTSVNERHIIRQEVVMRSRMVERGSSYEIATPVGDVDSTIRSVNRKGGRFG
jgi:hypothetical protein